MNQCMQHIQLKFVEIDIQDPFPKYLLHWALNEFYWKPKTFIYKCFCFFLFHETSITVIIIISSRSNAIIILRSTLSIVFPLTAYFQVLLISSNDDFLFSWY